MENSNLRQIIRESIQEYIREIDGVAEIAALEAKKAKTEEAIEERKSLMNMDGLEEAHRKMIDKNKVKELEKEIKHLEKSLAKYEKQLDKLKNKGKKKSEEPSEEKEMVDEMTSEVETRVEENMTEETEESLNEQFLYMQKLAGIITESEFKQKVEMLNEDILELKQMSKQLYSFLKKKGFLPELKNQLQTGKPQKIGEGENAVQIVVVDKPDERVMIGITAESVAKVLVGGGNDWYNKATQKFGQNITSNAMNAKGNWFRNPEIIKYVDNLGNEILKQIFAKYPNMIYAFSKQDGFWYILEFKFKETAKGGTANPNQRPNAPKPTA